MYKVYCGICHDEISQKDEYFPYCCDKPQCWCSCIPENTPYKYVTRCGGCDSKVVCATCSNIDYDLGRLCEGCYTTAEKIRSLLQHEAD